MVLINGPPGDPQGLTVDWRGIKQLPYDIDQQPGEKSAMGVLMLDAPNDFGVYLHDTPGKDVFLPAARQKSNGCVRVEDMAELAALIMSDGDETQVDSLDDAVATGETRRLMLDKPVPVYLLYWTAIGGEDGTVGFRPDFYGRDKPLLAALAADRRGS
jgi:murein L,D-transpeptidase YcbB/YkuD